MAGKRKAKQKKIPKPIPMISTTDTNTVVENEDDEKDAGIRTIKTQLRRILQPQYRDALIEAITEKSIMATKICVLASQLLLFRCQRAFEEKHYDFFNRIGEKEIRSCFYDVLQKNIHKSPEFLELSNNGDWPNADHFGNAMNDLIDMHVTNTKNTLSVSCAKRLRQYLRMKIFEINNSDPIVRYEEKDIDHVISLAIYGKDSIIINGIDDVAKRERRTMLLDMVVSKCWWDIPHNNISRFTKINWFKSIQFWLTLQREIDAFNTSDLYREERRIQREELAERKRCRKRNHRPCTCTQPVDQGTADQYVEKGPPKVKNLAVIPICSFRRTHYTLDSKTLHYLVNGLKIGPRKNGKRGSRNITSQEFLKNKEWYWHQYFDMHKIKRLGRGKKNFRFRILSNGQAVSLQFDIDKTKTKPFDKESIVKNRKKFKKEGGSDPGVNTWNATTVHDLETHKEVNYTISSKQYHYWTKQKLRTRQEKRWTKDFVKEEQKDRENRKFYPMMPSPMGQNWRDYIRHRMKMMERGIAVYTTDKYTRLNFDKYVRSNSVCDSIAGMITGHQPTLMHIGGCEMSPSSPIGIKKSLRCPGTRKMIRSYRKCPGCMINMVDEYYTSQTCAKCFGRFDRRTRRHRYKVCLDCRPDRNAMLPDGNAMLPSMIVCKVNRRKMREKQLIQFLLEKEAEEGSLNQAVGNDVQQPNQPNTERLLPNVAIYHKKWYVNPVSGVLEYVNFNQTDEMGAAKWAKHQMPRVHKTPWHRDIVAAKCIMIKGHCDVFDLVLPENLQRPSN